MKLKRLDIHGFKSFYHRTTLVFDGGITAVVGPNGCGKSNIVDSIKWVMGEQGARALRGNAMEDVLFAGSERRGPMGMCDVRLTFVNDGSTEVPARWKDVAEFAIERRLERGKGSDYLLNRQRCRLADVQELVAGTGVGSGPGGQRAYAIIEQGQISRIVSAKAGERRLLIEEAAGITRYQARKRSAERKIIQTRQNLERIDDIIGEVEVRLRSLSRQARKAERYREYQAEAREIGARVAAFAVLDAVTQERSLAQAEAARAEADERLAVALEAAEHFTADAEALERAAEHSCQAAAEAVSKADSQVELLRGQIALAEQEARGHAEQIERASGSLDRLAGTQSEREIERQGALADLDLLDAEPESEVQPEALQEARDQAMAALREARSKLEASRRLETEQAQRVARARAALDAARRRVMDLGERAAAASDEKRAVADELLSIMGELDSAQAAVDATQRAISEAAERRVDAERARTEALELLKQRGAIEREAARLSTRLESRRDSLVELERGREGLGDGTRAVLDRALPGVVGPLRELLGAVPEHLERAVAAALGPLLGGIAVREQSAALAALDGLRQAGKGRVLALDLSAVAEPAAVDPVGGQSNPQPHPQSLASLLAPSLLTRLVGHALVCKDVADAAATAAQWPGALVVTVEGTRLEAGVWQGGAASADAAPLSRRREIEALGERIEQGAVTLAEAVEAVAQARAHAAAAQVALEGAGTERHKAELRRAEAAKDLHRLEADVDRCKARLHRVSAQAQDLAESADEAGALTEEAIDTLDEAESASTDHSREIEGAALACGEAERRRDAAVARVHEAEKIAIERRARRTSAVAALARLDRGLAELRKQVQTLKTSRAEAKARGSLLQTRMARLATQLLAAQEAVELSTASLKQAQAHRLDRAEAARTARVAGSASRRARDAAREQLNTARLELQAARLERAHLAERAEAEFGASEEALLAAHREAKRPEPVDLERLSQLTALVSRMGDVNLQAIEEHAEVEQRHVFLLAQREDLVASLEDLETAISHINRASRALFKATFEAVNAQFQLLFPRLFRGGDATLRLTHPDDLLTTGIEMDARPPGKKVQSISLLSGGEKAMCAIALVFAVFKVRPSPFCLLDEVDAPLDDANIGRFNEVVREMSRTSQILLITHNKRTMEIADCLYGITMEESGISKLVSTRMT